MRYAVDVTVTSGASAEVLFRHLAVAGAWSVWSGLPARAVRERAGVGIGDGVGSVRRMGPAREETVVYDPPRHFAYRMLAGLPVDDYRADVTFEPREDGGTTVRWRARFAPRVPGTGPLMRVVLTRVLSRFARNLAAHAEDCRAGCPAHSS
ncbi:SRPBCC family protein [Thermomonospora amylolytica]|uniref:SRPBCC family protein n=1 Tax=Thermomonospora amylolytica TaxID=1411117 RepID=UPI000E6D32EB|nr:SRPBCC family protein [Thermomonospora amylolytica]